MPTDDEDIAGERMVDEDAGAATEMVIGVCTLPLFFIFCS